MSLSLEIIQIKTMSISKYFQSKWNWLDISIIMVNFFYFMTKYLEPMPKDFKYEQRFELIILDLVMFGFSFFKMMSFLRIFE